jgi:two-component system chemotaxis response regulator CheY
MTLNVMIVDDSLIMVKKLEAIVHELGHKVTRACQSGEDAVRDYSHVKPDVVMMDITMPGIDGIEATTQIRAAHPDARVVMVTSHGQEGMVLGALKAGAMGYVLKPVAKDKLAAMIDRAMTKSPSQ